MSEKKVEQKFLAKWNCYWIYVWVVRGEICIVEKKFLILFLKLLDRCCDSNASKQNKRRIFDQNLNIQKFHKFKMKYCLGILDALDAHNIENNLQAHLKFGIFMHFFKAKWLKLQSIWENHGHGDFFKKNCKSYNKILPNFH